MKNGLPGQKFVGYPRVLHSADADRLEALGYAEKGFVALLMLLTTPMLIFHRSGLFSIGARQAAVAVFIDLAMALATYKCYALLVKGKKLHPLWALLPALAYGIGFLAIASLIEDPGQSAFVFGGCFIYLPGLKMSESALRDAGYGHHGLSWKRLRRAVDERRLADQAGYAPPIPDDMLSGGPPNKAA